MSVKSKQKITTMRNIHKIGKELFITSDETAYPYALHYQKEVLKIRAVGENSGELYHDKGFSYPDQCKKIILTTDLELIKDGVQAIDDEFLEWFVKNPSCEEVEVDKTIPYNFDDLDSVRQDKFLELFYKSELFDEIKYNDVFDWSVNEGKNFLKLYPTFKIIIPKEEPKQETLEEYTGGLEMGQIPEKQENCCTPVGHIRRYKDCIGCDKKPKQETLEEFAEKLTNDFPALEVRFNMSTEEIYGWFLEALQKGAKWQKERMYSEDDIIKAFYTDSRE